MGVFGCCPRSLHERYMELPPFHESITRFLLPDSSPVDVSYVGCLLMKAVRLWKSTDVIIKKVDHPEDPGGGQS